MAVNYNDGNWHGWNGGECPVHPESEVEVVGGWDDAWKTKAHERNVAWDNVCAFRVIKEHKSPREFTLYVDSGGSAATWYNGDSMPDLPYCQVVKVREVIE